MSFDEFLQIPPYSLDREEKNRLLTARLTELTELHRARCPEYARILDSIAYDSGSVRSCADVPFLPVRLFKDMDLKSIPQEGVVKTMTSSGTSGQATSKIYLDRTTSANQQKVMVKIVSDFTGSGRMPMIILDCPSVVKDRRMFSARGAGILGFSIFGSKRIYALNDDMQLDVEAVSAFLQAHQGEPILLFGFTFMVWQHFYKELVRLREQGIRLDLSNGILIHGGGWKKLAGEAVSQEEFHARLRDVCGLERIHDYYGMVEQTGCIYMQCECGHLHASVFSDILFRRPQDLGVCGVGEPGIIQVLSSIPESYPGHSLLTEDEGVLLGEDDCPCGRKGKYFKVLGRLKNAEIRGCSDTYAADRARLSALPGAGEEKDALSGLEFLVGNKATVTNMPSLPPLAPFSEEIVSFLNDLSQELMRDREARAFSDVVTLGFWLRRASVLKLKDRFLRDDKNYFVGRGVAFHITPSNVPVNYAYSLFTGLMCGNANIVRIPSKDFPQVGIINRAILAVLEKHECLAPYIALVRYGRSREVNSYLSSLCDVRIVWGGDATIAELRNAPLPPRATEITFADRYSLAVIDSEFYLDLVTGEKRKREPKQIALDFYNDTYLSDQNACTSPRIVVWTGREKEAAKKLFWDELYKLVKERYSLQPIKAVDKLSIAFEAAASELGRMRRNEVIDNRLVRVQVWEVSSRLMEHRGDSGYFYEFDCDDILQLRDLCSDTHCQTIGMLGDAALVKPLLQAGIKGVDRIVPIGHTMDFDLLWDGYDLFERLTRTVSVAV